MAKPSARVWQRPAADDDIPFARSGAGNGRAGDDFSIRSQPRAKIEAITRLRPRSNPVQTSPMMGWLPDIGQLGEGHRVGAGAGRRTLLC